MSIERHESRPRMSQVVINNGIVYLAGQAVSYTHLTLPTIYSV